MADQGSQSAAAAAGQAGAGHDAALGRWAAPNLQPGSGGLPPGGPGAWLIMFGPPFRPGGPPRATWVDGRRL
eukprot:526698-Alexandrium_andersonii.AAC.1